MPSRSSSIFRIGITCAAATGFVGCGYGFYSPSRDTEAVVSRERAANDIERDAQKLQGANAALYDKKSRWESRLATIRREINSLEAEPGAPDMTRDYQRLQELHEEERATRIKIREVNEQIDKEVLRQNQLREKDR